MQSGSGLISPSSPVFDEESHLQTAIVNNIAGSDTDNKTSQRDISKREGMFAVTAHRQNLRGSYPRKYSVPPTRGPPTGPA